LAAFLDGLNLDLGKLPGFNLDLGSLDLGGFVLPGINLPSIDWGGLFTGGKLDLGKLRLPDGGLNLDFLGGLGFPTLDLDLGNIKLPSIDFGNLVIPCIPIPFIVNCNVGGGGGTVEIPCIPIPFIRTCPAPTTRPPPPTTAPPTTPAPVTTPPPPRECKIPLDIGILLDVSSSIGQKAWANVPDFVRGFADSLNLETARLGVYQFSWRARKVWWLTNDMAEMDKWLKHRKMTRLWGGTTKTNLGLDMVKSDFDKRGRAGVHKIAFVLTDGNPYPEAKPWPLVQASAKALQDIADVIAVGIGSGVDQDTLKMIAGKDENVYNVANYDDLIDRKDDIIRDLCQA